MSLSNATAQASHYKLDNHTAVATLMLKVIEADGEIDHLEIAHMVNLLRRQFSLDTSEIEDLLRSARHIARRNITIANLTGALCRDWTMTARQRLLNDFWTLASADERIRSDERRMIHQIATHLQLKSDEITRAEYIAETKMELGIQIQ